MFYSSSQSKHYDAINHSFLKIVNKYIDLTCKSDVMLLKFNAPCTELIERLVKIEGNGF